MSLSSPSGYHRIQKAPIPLTDACRACSFSKTPPQPTLPTPRGNNTSQSDPAGCQLKLHQQRIWHHLCIFPIQISCWVGKEEPLDPPKVTLDPCEDIPASSEFFLLVSKDLPNHGCDRHVVLVPATMNISVKRKNRGYLNILSTASLYLCTGSRYYSTSLRAILVLLYCIPHL